MGTEKYKLTQKTIAILEENYNDYMNSRNSKVPKCIFCPECRFQQCSGKCLTNLEKSFEIPVKIPDIRYAAMGIDELIKSLDEKYGRVSIRDGQIIFIKE